MDGAKQASQGRLRESKCEVEHIGITATLFVAYFVMVMGMGSEPGEACDPEWGCRGLDSLCLAGDDGYCGLHCEDTGDGHSAQPDVGTTPVCLRP